MPFLCERNDMTERTCSVDGCEKTPRSSGAELCKMHYHRLYRHGSVDKVATRSGVTASHGRRYKTVYRPHHPLASKHGVVYAHRLALYEAIGSGVHPCHWCGKQLSWESTRGDADCLNVDHLNGVGDDNRAENLVPACTRCNVHRAGIARAAALRSAGWWSKNDTIAALKGSGRKAFPDGQPVT